MYYDIFDIANYVINYYNINNNQIAKNCELTSLKLNKLLFFIIGNLEQYQLINRFDSEVIIHNIEFKAWHYGPVEWNVHSLLNKTSNTSSIINTLLLNRSYLPLFDKETKTLIDFILNGSLTKTRSHLITLSQLFNCWKKTYRNNLNVIPYNDIVHEFMKYDGVVI